MEAEAAVESGGGIGTDFAARDGEEEVVLGKGTVRVDVVPVDGAPVVVLRVGDGGGRDESGALEVVGEREGPGFERDGPL